MLSITEARQRYSSATMPDHLLMHEHEVRVGRQITEAIENCEKSTTYEVPWMLPGPWPTYNVQEITAQLLKRIRLKGYKVRLVHLNPPILEISGWDTQPTFQQLQQQQPARVPREKKTVTIVPTATLMHDARRLKTRLIRLNSK